MSELEKKILRFLLSAAAYSENAICKNLGISLEELRNSFNILEKNGYLEAYETFLAREQLNENNSCPSHGGCSSCHSCSHSSSCGCGAQAKEDYSDIRVITEKAVEEFGSD
ncbi:Lrp/AsnC family transcriptional regulator [Fusobacterium necrophorum]|uniref:Lrp/AsnC family transcriptional regulator n=1 Tax=Fusobacterium necrophorum TaxID=859 RepID=A0A4Q2L055_9FUSO|nr:Lrp/AsnC family transcriptional regulator [Fusobacterium necrophorum]RXZ71368.1 Lrp/AsnC family transcriptional regulator [Fusobacterium necrophorum]